MKTNQKWPRTSLLLRRVAANGPTPRSRITGVASDQRVYSHIPGISSNPIASVEIVTAINAATITLGT